MRKVLRESLYLLFAGQMASTIRGETPSTELSLSYEDFQMLRPEIGNSSWRGAMAKAKQRRWVVSRVENGVTRFQLTRYGREQISTDFIALQQVQTSPGNWTLLILQPLEGKRQQYAALKRELEQSGAALIIPSLYAWPREVYSQDLVRRLEGCGFLPCFLLVDPRRSRPTQLESFWRNGPVLQKKIRNATQNSKEMKSLLVNVSQKKQLHHQQKAKIGSLLLSGMATLGQFQWFEVDSDLISSHILPLAEQIDSLVKQYMSASGINS